LIGSANKDGFRFRKNNTSVKDTRRISTEFVIDGVQALPAVLNGADQQILEEEQSLLAQMEGLQKQYGSIAQIPREEILNRGFSRFYNGVRYKLFKPLTTATGAVVVG